MANLFRRAGTSIARIFQSAADPAAVAGQVQLYAKDSGGVTKPFMCDGGGTITEIGAVSASTIIASTTLASPASTISVSGLNGDLHGEYEIEFNYVASSTASHDVDIRPNGDAGANRQTTRRFENQIWAHIGGYVAANGTTTTPMYWRSTFYCWARRVGSYQRRFIMDSTLTYNSNLIGRWESWTTYANETANLTSFTIGTTNIQFATGSELIVRLLVR